MKIVRILFACSLVIYLFISVGWSNILVSLSRIHFSWATCVVFLLLLIFFMGTLNLWILLHQYKLDFRKFIRSYIHSWALSLITPGQIGDASLPYFLKKKGVPVHQSGTAYLVDKIISLTVLIFIVLLCKGYILPGLHISFSMSGGVLTMFCAIFTILLIGLFWKRTRVLQQSQHWLSSCIRELKSYQDKPFLLIINMVLTWLKWGVLSMVYLCAFFAFQINVPWPEVGLIPMLSTLIGYIPVSIGGIGTVEISSVYLFGQIGIGEADVLSVYILLRSGQFLLALLLVVSGLVFDWTRAKKRD